MVLPDLSHPELLWWLVLLPVFYWLSLPPRPRKRVTTAHMVQWQAAVRRLGRRPVRFRKLRFWLLVVGLFAVVGAMTGPTIGAVEGPRRLVVLIDTSASLGARVAESTAYEGLRAELRDRLEALPRHIEVRFALCAAGVSVHRGDREELLAAVPALSSGLGGVDWESIAAALTDDETAVWTLTDGLGRVPPPKTGALSLFGNGGANLGITSCAVDDRWPLPDVTLRLELQRFGAGPQTVSVQLSGAVEPVGPVPVDISVDANGLGRGHVEIKVQRDGGGWLELEIADAAGALAVDDKIRIWLPEPPAPDIAVLAGPESGPAVHVAARILAAESGGRVVELGAERAGFLLVDGGHLEKVPTRAITFGTSFGTRRPGSADYVEDVFVVDWDREDGITAGLDLSELEVQRALRASGLPPGRVLARGDAGPLIMLVESQSAATVHFAFRLADSNLSLLPALPQILRRVYARSYGEAAKPRMDPQNLLAASESDLRPRPELTPERPLPSFGRDGNSLVVPLLLLALFALVARVYT